MLLLILLSACRESSQKKIARFYFDSEVLVNRQIELLNKENPKLEKTALVDGKSETAILFKPNWKKEFALFAQANINKSALQGLFTQDSILTDGLKTIIYKASKPGLPADLLAITYNGSEIKTLEASVSKENFLASSKRKLSMHFGPGESLLSYSLTGFEKVIFSDTTHFRLADRIIKP